MLVIDKGLVMRAAELLMMAARSAKDEEGRRTSVRLPLTPMPPMKTGTASSDVNPFVCGYDMEKIGEIVLTAVSSLCGHPCQISAEADEWLNRPLMRRALVRASHHETTDQQKGFF